MVNRVGGLRVLRNRTGARKRQLIAGRSLPRAEGDLRGKSGLRHWIATRAAGKVAVGS